MNVYYFLKIIHVISASLFVGASFASFIIYKFALKGGDINIIKKTHFLTNRIAWLVILPSAIFQLITGFSIIAAKPYSPYLVWVQVVIVGYFVLAMLGLGILYYHKQNSDCLNTLANDAALPLPKVFSQNLKLQAKLIYLSVIALITIIFFMANR